MTLSIKAIVTATVAAAALTAPQGAQARTPFVAMGYAKHAAWEQAKDYKETWEVNWAGADENKYRCRRVSRSAVDCTTTMLFWNPQDGCVVPELLDPADGPHSRVTPNGEECSEGSYYDAWYEGERHSWTMRYRAMRARDGSPWVWAYFPKDRYAETDPTERKFGGRALRVVPEGY
jgi:hypothetical protein